MLIPLSEPNRFRYIRIHPATNRVHLLVPFIAGQDISTDNTCKSEVELKAFFEGGAINELQSYESTLEFHISLMEKGPLRQAKEERLAQIKLYLKAIINMRESYKDVTNHFLTKPSNLYSMQLRPSEQDPYSVVVNPVFTMNRDNDSQGTPKSALFIAMHEAYPNVSIAPLDPKSQLIAEVLNVLSSPDVSFTSIQTEMTTQCQRLFGVNVDFKQMSNPDKTGPIYLPVNQVYIDRTIGFSPEAPATTQEYVNELWNACAPNIGASIVTKPFYSVRDSQEKDQAEKLSILTQFFLAQINIYCKAKGISDKNFGVILDSSPELSRELVKIIVSVLVAGGPVEESIYTFLNNHSQTFRLAQSLTEKDKKTIQKKFESTYRTVTALKENPHMDDFMILDMETRSENATFVTHQGLICTDFANIVSKDLNQSYFDEIRQEAVSHPKIITLQDEATVTIDIKPEALMDKLSDVQWERLPKNVVEACHASPAFKVRQLLDDVAKGKQEEANVILQSSAEIQTLLRAPGKFTDYSGRIFHCTAYEYAYWAKDRHMCRMLESHMDDETKAVLLAKVNEMEGSGLAYQQHGQSYKNPHYDMSFVLKNLSPDEFRELQKIVGQGSAKIQQATQDNYQKIAITATEYEILKKVLEQYKPTGFFSFFSVSPKTICDKLQFDFHSLLTALDTYVANYKSNWSEHERDMCWLTVGMAQRDAVAHIAHEYCRQDRSFNPVPSFNEETLPRVLTIKNYYTTDKSWFPLSSSTSGLGFDFALARTPDSVADCKHASGRLLRDGDLAAVRHLDEVRIADLTQSREYLSRPANHAILAH